MVDNINWATQRLQAVVNEFPEQQHVLLRHKNVPSEQSYSKATNPNSNRAYNNNNIIV